MKVITVREIIEIEDLAEKKFSVLRQELMENAGKNSARWIENFAAKKSLPKKILIVCGSGNNGGDGFVCARYLYESGFFVSIIFVSKESKLKGPAKNNFNKIKKNKKTRIIKAGNVKKLKEISGLFDDAVLVVDCILGTGIKGEVSGFYKDLISFLNSISNPVISLDVPSGLDADTGKGFCVKAYATLAMGLPKVGLLKTCAEENVGFLHTINIGIPEELTRNVENNIEYIQPDDFKDLIKRRKYSDHKGSCGHTLIIAGSQKYTGAAELCVRGALRSGSGLVTLAIPKSLQKNYQIKFSEAMTTGLPETEDGSLSYDAYNMLKDFIDEKIDSIAIGPGLGQNPDTRKLIKKIISESGVPVVIDADGISAVSDELLTLRKAKAPLVLTPHPGEMARLLNDSVENVQNDRWGIAQGLSDKYDITIVLKGYHTVVAGKKEKIYINGSGNPGMASGGMGDVLTGIISGLIAQGFTPFESSKIGVYAHGAAGDLVMEELGERGMLASDLVEKLPCVLNRICGRK